MRPGTRRRDVARLMSTYGTVVFSTSGGAVTGCHLVHGFGRKPVKIDVAEWRRRYPGEPMEGDHDILDFGYWVRNGTYEAPCEEWREDREKRIRAEKEHS